MRRFAVAVIVAVAIWASSMLIAKALREYTTLFFFHPLAPFASTIETIGQIVAILVALVLLLRSRKHK